MNSSKFDRHFSALDGKLNRNQALSEAILDTSVDAIITIDERGNILSFNRAATNMFGYEESEVSGKNVNLLMPLPYSREHDKYLKDYKETGQKKIIGKGREVQGLKKDGTVFPIDLAVSEVTWKGNRIFAGLIKDLTLRRELERRILEIGNEERRRIGRNLHDGLGQMLTGIRMISENLARKLEENGLPYAEEVREISGLINDADEYARILSQDMVQVEIEKKGLSVALQKLCKRTEKERGIHCRYFENGNVEVENHTMTLHLFRIAKESIEHAIKHTDVKNIHIRLSRNRLQTSLSIADDGKDFEPDQDAGIRMMKHRAGSMGGILEIVRTPEGQNEVQCIIPNNLRHL